MTDPAIQTSTEVWRESTQDLAPIRTSPTPPAQYDIYPAFPLGPGKIDIGFEALAERISGYRKVTVDGYGGVIWEDLRRRLQASLDACGLHVNWVSIDDALKPEADVDRIVAPFLGGDDPLFGRRFTGRLQDFFSREKLLNLRPEPGTNLNIIYGTGASLAEWDGPLVYVDVPKNEIQFRSRAGSVRNLGAEEPREPRNMYKRYYFVDWPALNRHKAGLLGRVDVLVDGQRPDSPAVMSGKDFRAGLALMSRNYFRARPWFEPGPWGGQWIKRHIPQVARDVPNYAWSFELIVPENGIAFESGGRLLEASFDFLMYHDHEAVLGTSAPRFGHEFPIRFDFLDTVGGGNLSLQCHPRPDFIRDHFGERFTQDETYYILDCEPGAQVYLGFRDDIDPAAFRAALEQSCEKGTEVDVDAFVQMLPARKHDLFLIPNGTVHCSGADNMVLEISATPYIFTFKMYDWLRLDLDGRPRPLNIDRAFENLYFERKGKRVRDELVAGPRVVDEGAGWRLVHLPTHREHFYDVHRYEFDDAVAAETGGSPHVMNLVEGRSIVLETSGGMRRRFNYAETFVIPAAAGSYRLINDESQPAKVVKAFMKPDFSFET